MNLLSRLLLVTAFCAPVLRAQTVSVSPVAATIGTSAGTVTLAVTLTYSGTMGSVGFQIGSVPANWTYVSKGGANPPEVAPFVGEMGSFGFAYTTIPASPARFEFTVAYPAGLSGSQVFSSVSAIFRFSENGVSRQQIVSAPNLVFSPAASGVTAPAISLQPSGASLVAGGSHTLAVNATGSSPLAFQWRRNGVAIAGATGSQYALSNLTSATAGTYTVLVSNAVGSVLSAPATITVSENAVRFPYAGFYLGSLSGGGSFALMVRDDRTGAFVGFSSSARKALVASSISVDPSGRLAGVMEPGLAASFAGETEPSRAALEGEFAVAGTFAVDGSLTGSVERLGLSFTASGPARSAGWERFAGYYPAGSAGGAGRAYVIVAPSGEGFAAVFTGSSEDGSRLTADTAGRLSGSSGFSGEIRAGGVLGLDYTPASGGTISFLGAETSIARQSERLLNISSRSPTGGNGDSLIAGFVVGGVAPRRLLLRVVGPGLSPFGVVGALPAARLELYRSGQLVASSNDWDEVPAKAAETAAIAAQVGAFALKPGSRDAALFAELLPGAYTLVAASQTSARGVALVEAYDADSNKATSAEKLVNIATRARAGSGDEALIAGFVVSGTVPKRLLVRGVGPGLAQFGVEEVLARTEIAVFSGDRVVIRNSGWSAGPEPAAIVAAASKVGAFPLPSGSADSALLAYFAPGAYTAQLTGPGNVSGNALIEVYEVP
ncbi:MAG: immunoglobulin domain-containing protein [Opitutaceae bacterium]